MSTTDSIPPHASPAGDPKSITGLLSRALRRIRSTPPRIIASPATRPSLAPLTQPFVRSPSSSLEPRRAAVALILRVVPPPNVPLPPSPPPAPPSLTDFFELDWVTHPAARPEILFLRRAKADASEAHANTRDAHVAFPGGRMEEGDEGGLYTGERAPTPPLSAVLVSPLSCALALALALA